MPHLRIGFLAHDWTQVDPWVHRLVSQTSSDENFNVVSLIKNSGSTKEQRVNWLYAMVNPLERLLFARAIPADPAPVQQLKASRPEIDSKDVNAISSLNLDVIICVEACLDPQKISQLAHHGVWFLDVFEKPKGLSALDAVVGRVPVANIGLHRYIGGNGTAEHLASAAINPKFLLARNLLFMKEKSVVLVLRELRRLFRTGRVGRNTDTPGKSKYMPGTGDMMGYFFNVVKQVTRRSVAAAKRKTGIRPEKFILLTGKGDALSFDPKSANEVISEGSDFQADPFLWGRDGKVYCFYEYYSHASKTGHIQVGELHDDEMTIIGDALKTDIHLSFPFLFEHEDELYMMPETWAAGRIEIWRCVEFPLKWELHSTALEGQRVADSMILRRDGKWWLFTNIATDIHFDNCSELHIFEIDGPNLTRVTPHLANPVVMDSRTARNAGRFHEIDGRLYRPSQDNAFGRYGYGLNIMEVEELSLETYSESLARRIDSSFDRKFSACHHFDAIGGRFIMDAFKVR